ncbi:MAG: hypothetical protein GC202_02210 [Alphaproteobacteria bacterium]|nr:hypothetical protein [Alphaproteobacteria bacterium]
MNEPTTWRAVLHFDEDAMPTRQQVETAFRQRVTAAHPDLGGSHEAVRQVIAARDTARAWFDARDPEWRAIVHADPRRRGGFFVSAKIGRDYTLRIDEQQRTVADANGAPPTLYVIPWPNDAEGQPLDWHADRLEVVVQHGRPVSLRATGVPVEESAAPTLDHAGFPHEIVN